MIQGQNPMVKRKILTQRSNLAGLAGCVFPGGGQIVRREPISALLVWAGVTLPLFWFALLTNQAVYRQLRAPAGQPMAPLGDWEFLSRFGQLKGFLPEVGALVVLALAVHLIAAYVAWEGTPRGLPTASGESADGETADPLAAPDPS